MFLNKSKAILAALGLASISSVSAMQTGENCPFSAKVWCVQDKNGKPCEDLYNVDTRPNQCGDRAITMHYEYCNELESNNVKAKALRVEVKYRNQLQSVTWYVDGEVFPLSKPMWGKQCRKAIHKTTINNCNKKTITGSVKFEGNRLDENNEPIVAWDPITGQANEDYCYGWGWYKEDIVQDAKPATPAPTPVATADPDPIAPEIDITISCGWYIGDQKISTCENMPQVSSTSDCIRTLKYTYTVNNQVEGGAYLQTVIDGNNQNILNGNPPIGTWSTVMTDYVDVCKNAGKKITKKGAAIAIADEVTDPIPGYDSTTYEHTIPTTPPVYTFDEMDCIYNGMSCESYMVNNGCFSGEVDFKYHVTNVGYTCHDITQIKAIVGGSNPRFLALDGIMRCDDRASCPGDKFQFVEKRFVNFCSLNLKPLEFNLVIDTSVTFNGSSSIFYRTTEFDKDPQKPPSPAPKPPTPAPKPPTPAPVAPTTGGSGEECTDHPTQLWLTFTSNSCSASSNGQFRRYTRGLRGLKHNSKSKTKTKKSKDESGNDGDEPTQPDVDYSCTDNIILQNDAKVQIVISSIDETQFYWTGYNICDGTEIMIAATEEGVIASDIKIKIYADAGNKGTMLHQTIIMHTACSTKAMSLGDVFGAMTITGIRNKSQGTIGK